MYLNVGARPGKNILSSRMLLALTRGRRNVTPSGARLKHGRRDVVRNCWRLVFVAVYYLVFCVFAAPSGAQDITTGLVGHWKLDETSGTTVYDSSGNGNDASMQGGLDAGTDSVSGRVGGALELEAANEQCIYSPFLNVSVDATYTFAAWFKASAPHFSFIVSEGNTSNGIPNTALANNNGVARAVWRDDGNFLKTVDGTTPIEDGGWHHLAAVADGSTLRLYVNGKEEGTGVSISGTISLDNTSIGCFRRASTSNYVDGVVDDVRIYNRVLTPEDVAALYAAWPGHLRYSTEYRVPEYYNESEWIAAGPGPYVANAVEFDIGTELNTYNVRTPSKQFLASVWFRKDTEGSASIYESYNTDILESQSSENIRFSTDGETSGTSALEFTLPAGTVTVGKWHHLLLSADVTGADPGNVMAYVDDMAASVNVTSIIDDTLRFDSGSGGGLDIGEDATGEWIGGMADLWWDNVSMDISVEANRRKFIDDYGNPVYLGSDGSRPTGNAPDIFLSGDTDTWHVNKGTGGGFTENGTLTDAVTAPGGAYAHVPMDGLVGWWRLDETSGSTIIDYASANDGTYMDESGSAANVHGQGGVFGGALPFSNYKVSFGANPDFDFSGTNAFTFSAWVKPQESGVRILHRGFGLGSNASYVLGRYHLDHTRWELQIRDGSSFLLARAPSGSVDMNVWSHITGTWNGSDLLLYENASVIASANDATFVLWDPPTTDYQETSIGGDGRGNASYFGGLIDDVMIWNRALDASEVATLYNAGVCANPKYMNGSVIYNTTHNVLQYCDGPYPGDGWRAMGPVPGPGGAGCSNPSYPEGMVMYNTTYNVLQYCDGVNWRALREPGPAPDPCAGSPTPGDVCADGSVYAGLSPDGNVAMYTTAADEGGFAWNNGNSSGYITTSQTSTTTGETNTTNLLTIDSDSGVGGTQPHLAAQQCANSTANGHSDWYLPAKDELNVLYTNKTAIGGFNISGSLPAGYYWSSTEYANYGAWGQRFSDGSQYNYTNKHRGLSVRCVRR